MQRFQTFSTLLCAGLLFTAANAHSDELGGTYSASVSYTAESEFNRHHVDYGDVNAIMVRAGYAVTGTPCENFSWSAGPIFDYTRLNASDRAPLPENGYVTGLQLGGVWRINSKWNLRADIRPGLYTDFEDVSGNDFNAPFIVAVTYRVTTNLMFVLGLGVNLRSDLGTVGGPGVLWNIDEKWTLNLILPKPTIGYAVNDRLGLYAGGEWRSSSFRVAEDFGTKHGNRDLNDDDFSYRELRALGGVRLAVSKSCQLSLEGGYVFDRRAEYRDADVTIKGDGAPFVQFGFAGSF